MESHQTIAIVIALLACSEVFILKFLLKRFILRGMPQNAAELAVLSAEEKAACRQKLSEFKNIQIMMIGFCILMMGFAAYLWNTPGFFN